VPIDKEKNTPAGAEHGPAAGPLFSDAGARSPDARIVEPAPVRRGANAAMKPRAVAIGVAISVVAGLAFSFGVCCFPPPGCVGIPHRRVHAPGGGAGGALYQRRAAIQTLAKKVAALQRRGERLTPNEPYLIVNSFANEVLVKKGKEVLLRAACSTGSYILLKSRDERRWIFSTPRGLFRVQSTMEAPVWHRPDWSFIEEGKPVPSKDAPERYETGVLGDYALTLGHGYMIHGTLYQRFLGLPVTHGCIRLGDDDLAYVYRNLHVGSQVYIY
jgi:L,D-transpeptidase ErfK/SrfK